MTLLTSSEMKAVPQAVEVVNEPEEQGLADLHGQAAAGGAGRKFSFDHREDGFDLGSLSVLLLRKSPVHLITNSSSRDAAARFGGNDATGSPALPDIFVIRFGIELGIGQHLAHRHQLPGGVEQSRQGSRIAPRSLPRALRKQNLLLHIRYHQPLQPVPMAGHAARMLFNTAYEKGADGVVGKPRAINGGRNAHVLLPAAQSPHRLSYPARDGVVRRVEKKNRAPDRVGMNSDRPLQKRQREGLAQAVLARAGEPGLVVVQVNGVRRVEGWWFAPTVGQRERAEEPERT